MRRNLTVRLLILVLFLASTLLVTISTKTEAFPLSRPALRCSVGRTWFGFGSKTKATAKVTWLHAQTLFGRLIPHWHHFSYSLYARVADQEDYNPPRNADGTHDYGNVSVNGLKRMTTPHSRVASVTGYTRWENDAYASGSVSMSGEDDNWSFCTKP